MSKSLARVSFMCIRVVLLLFWNGIASYSGAFFPHAFPSKRSSRSVTT